jgi:hypothetical protein
MNEWDCSLISGSIDSEIVSNQCWPLFVHYIDVFSKVIITSIITSRIDISTRSHAMPLSNSRHEILTHQHLLLTLFYFYFNP